MNTPSAILPAQFPQDLETVRTLFLEYAAGLGVDLCFQGFGDELATLPGKYALPSGRIFLAWKAGQAVGCIALRPLAGNDCEMKRLYVQPGARGEQLGRRLAERVCQAARQAGYARICLDTLDSMHEAQALYQSLGFQEIEAYTFNPLPGTKYLAQVL